MTPPSFTIGHSNRPQEVIVGMLREARVKLVVDVRSFPKSRANPDFNDDRFPDVLTAHQISYRHMIALGGRRPKQPLVDPEINAFWRVQSFHNYADYTLGATFQEALGELLGLARARSVALMCAEAVWWRCHRRIIADYLMFSGQAVTHLMAPGRMEVASLTEGARQRGDGKVVYPKN